MANGERWQDYWGLDNTIACPRELDFGTKIKLGDKIYTCRDRGGAIVKTYSGEYWIDILSKENPYWHGAVQKAYLVEINP